MKSKSRGELQRMSDIMEQIHAHMLIMEDRLETGKLEEGKFPVHLFFLTLAFSMCCLHSWGRTRPDSGL